MGKRCCGCLPLSDDGNRVGSAGTRLSETNDSAVEIKAGLCNADPITKQGKRVQMAQMLCIPLVPLIILVVQACLSLSDAITSKGAIELMTTTMATSRQIASLVNVISLERDSAVQFVAFQARAVDDAVLKAAYSGTDRQLGAVAWPSAQPGDPGYMSSAEKFSAALREVRNRTRTLARDHDVNDTVASLFAFYVNVNERLLASVVKATQMTDDGFVWKKVFVYYLLLRAKENFSMVASLGLEWFASRNLTAEEFTNLVESYSLATDHLRKTVFYYVDVVRLIYPEWSPDSGVFPFSSTLADGRFSISGPSYASNVDAGVRAMLADDVSGGPEGHRQVLDVTEWISNTSAFIRVVGDAAVAVDRLVTSE